MREYDGCSCWLCGGEATGTDPLDTHHIFGGADRKKCDKDRLTVRLHHFSCHEFGAEAVHRNAENMKALRAWGQEKAMREFGWSVEEFRLRYGKNYLEQETLDAIERDA